VSHTLVTIVSPVAQDQCERARDLVESLGNPAAEPVREAFEAIAAAPGDLAIHFASLTVFPASAGGGHLLLEFSADGPRDSLIAALATHLGPLLRDVYALAADRGSATLDRYWTSHVVEVGQGFFDNAGVVFAGTPGLSVRRIRQEAALREHLKPLVEQHEAPFSSALAVLDRVRSALETDPAFSWALQADDVAALQDQRTGVGPLLRTGRRLDVPVAARGARAGHGRTRVRCRSQRRGPHPRGDDRVGRPDRDRDRGTRRARDRLRRLPPEGEPRRS
jgi:hypothetical protein